MTKHNLASSLAWLLQQENPADHITHQHTLVPATDTVLDGADPSSQDMARLQLAPQPPQRSNGLLSRTAANPLPTPAPSHSTVQQQHQTPGVTLKPASRPTPSRLLQTPKTEDDFDFDNNEDAFDIDEIDLTGGNVTTSSFGDFGQPTQLWSEGAATRPEPPSITRGRKRKSGEYEEDIDFHRPSSGRAYKTQPAKDNVLRVKAEGSGAVADADQMDYEEELPTTQTTMKVRRSPGSASSSRPSSRQESNVFYSTRTSITSAKRNVVEDSDDEVEAITRGPKRESSESGPVPSGPAIVEEPRTTTLESVVKAEISADQVEKAKLWGASDGQVTLEQAPIETRNIITTYPEPPASSSMPPPTPATTSAKLSKEQEAFLQRFLQLSQHSCTGILRRLRTAKDEIIEKALEEAEDAGQTSLATKQQKSLILSRIQAVQSVIEQRTSLVSLIARKDEVKMKLRQLLEKDECDDEQDRVSVELRRLKDEVERAGSTMFMLLQQAGYATDESIRDISSEGVIKSPVRASCNVLVASTQHHQVIRRTPQKQSATNYPDFPSQHSQSVVQTPLPIRSPIRVFNDRTGAGFSKHNAPEAPIALQLSRSASDLACSSTRPQNGHASTDLPRMHALNRSRTMHELPTFDHGDDEEADQHFTRNMASPPPDIFSDSEFDDDNDIEDMLEAAEAYEQSFEHSSDQPLPVKPRSAGILKRDVLIEVTNNVKCPSPRKAQLTQPATAVNLQRYKWSSDVMSALKKRFHLNGFRHNQLEAINATLAGKDAFVLMPTGGGKSLCYQLPSVVSSGETRGVTIVISPLLSLMQDQVDHLQKLKIQAFLVNSEVTPEHKKFVFEALSGPHPEQFIQLLYVTPEMLSKSERINKVFSQLHKNGRLARIVIDEAHCVSQWGHDFRPDYKELGVVRRQFPGVPVMALTATATENVKLDVMHNLGMDGCDVFTQSFNRPNLTYEVRRKGVAKDTLKSIASTILDHYRGKSGIIYCLSRKNCEKLADGLKKGYGINAAHYHAGMDPPERVAVQKGWQAGEHDVIVATIAFGMGIDKPDVRYVIHHTIPKSLEGYYQETGRAGRDGKQSGCYLYYGYGDTSSIKSMIEKGDGNEQQKQRQKLLLRNMVQFCENRSDCRRVQVLAYFNEHFNRDACQGSCDNCNSDSVFETQDFSGHARNVIRLVKQIRQHKVTLLQCVDIYRGARGQTNSGEDVSELIEAGLGSDLDRGDVERLFYRLLSEDAFQEAQEANKSGFFTAYLQLGPSYLKFERGRENFDMQVRISPKGKSKGKAKATTSKTGGRKTKANDGIDEMDYLASTCVSSPIQDRTQRRQRRQNRVVEDEDEESDAAFEEVRPAMPQRTSRARDMVLTIDEQIDQLDDVHRHIMNDFVDKARKMIDNVVREKALRQRPVSDSTLKTIGMTLPPTEDALLEVDGINKNKLKSCGKALLKLIQEARRDCQAMLEAQGGESSPREDQDVVEISDDGASDDAADHSESSRYFSVDTTDRVEQFNQRGSQIPTYSNTGKKASGRNSGSQSRRGSFFKNKYGRKGKTPGTAGVTKKKRGSGSKNSTGSNSANSVLTAIRNHSGARNGSAANTARIGMMPT